LAVLLEHKISGIIHLKPQSLKKTGSQPLRKLGNAGIEVKYYDDSISELNSIETSSRLVITFSTKSFVR